MFLLLLHVQFMQPGFYFFDSHGRICNHRLTFHAMAPISHKIFSGEKKCMHQTKKMLYIFTCWISQEMMLFCLSNDALCMINAPLWWRIGKPWIHWEKQIWFFLFSCNSSSNLTEEWTHNTACCWAVGNNSQWNFGVSNSKPMALFSLLHSRPVTDGLMNHLINLSSPCNTVGIKEKLCFRLNLHGLYFLNVQCF